MDWKTAGQGWGARSLEWAYLFEPYAEPANELVLDRLGVGLGTRLVDVACGSGLAAHRASRRGALVAGLDASDALIHVARVRTPEGDFRVGDMFALPFADDGFDVATSFNAIWKGCDEALVEVRRVLVDGGHFGMTFWGDYSRLGLLPYFLKVIECSPASHGSAMTEQGDTSQVVDDMFTATGFQVSERGTVSVINEWPDVATAVRALAAAGPSVPAIEHLGYDEFCEALSEVVAPMYDSRSGIRISSEFGWVTAQPT